MASRRKKIKYLSFQVGTSWFALPIASIEGVAPSAEMVAIPGNASRVSLGIVYVLGQLMTVVDIAPLFNLGSLRDAQQFLVFQRGRDYYAVRVTAVGDIIDGSQAREVRKSAVSCAQRSVTHRKRTIRLLDHELLIRDYVCK